MIQYLNVIQQTVIFIKYYYYLILILYLLHIFILNPLLNIHLLITLNHMHLIFQQETNLINNILLSNIHNISIITLIYINLVSYIILLQ